MMAIIILACAAPAHAACDCLAITTSAVDQAAPGRTMTRLSWDPSPTSTVTGYRVHHKTFPLATPKADRVPPYSYTRDAGDVLTEALDLKFYPDKVRCFYVTAYDGAGRPSGPSNIVCDDD